MNFIYFLLGVILCLILFIALMHLIHWVFDYEVLHHEVFSWFDGTLIGSTVQKSIFCKFKRLPFFFIKHHLGNEKLGYHPTEHKDYSKFLEEVREIKNNLKSN